MIIPACTQWFSPHFLFFNVKTWVLDTRKVWNNTFVWKPSSLLIRQSDCRGLKLNLPGGCWSLGEAGPHQVFYKKSFVGKKNPIFSNAIINSSLTWMGSSEYELSWTLMELSCSIQVLWINLLKRSVKRMTINIKRCAFSHWNKYTAFCVYVLIILIFMIILVFFIVIWNHYSVYIW